MEGYIPVYLLFFKTLPGTEPSRRNWSLRQKEPHIPWTNCQCLAEPDVLTRYSAQSLTSSPVVGVQLGIGWSGASRWWCKRNLPNWKSNGRVPPIFLEAWFRGSEFHHFFLKKGVKIIFQKRNTIKKWWQHVATTSRVTVRSPLHSWWFPSWESPDFPRGKKVPRFQGAKSAGKNFWKVGSSHPPLKKMMVENFWMMINL